MTNHPNRSVRKLPADVYYTSRNGGVYVRWNGRPEGSVSVTNSKDVAYGLTDADGCDDDGFSWQPTPLQGASGSCRRAAILRMAADYLS